MNDHFHKLYLVLGLGVLVWSGIHPYDRFTWFLEVFPAIIGVGVLLYTYKRFPLTQLCYLAILIHAAILMIGGKYTYARVPLGFWMQDTFGFVRNHYDRLGHIAQGFFPALVAREILIRIVKLKHGRWLFFIVTCICLAISAFYELIEWWVAMATGTAADDFLGTQGDVWDTQWDMCLALMGAIASQLMFSKIQNRQIQDLSI